MPWLEGCGRGLPRKDDGGNRQTPLTVQSAELIRPRWAPKCGVTTKLQAISGSKAPSSGEIVILVIAGAAPEHGVEFVFGLGLLLSRHGGLADDRD